MYTEAMITALDCQICDSKVQEQSARALLLLGGHFSYARDVVFHPSISSNTS
jgi:hypothetical protein